jgi:hypothetical protein
MRRTLSRQHGLSFVIAFDLEELVGRETCCDVTGNGNEAAKDGVGTRGARLKPEPGRVLNLEISRTIYAKRPERIAGGRLLAESPELGHELNWRKSGIRGCDSLQDAIRCEQFFLARSDAIIPKYTFDTFDVLNSRENLPSATDGMPIKPPSGPVAWNAFRQPRVTVLMQASDEPAFKPAQQRITD